MYSPSFSVGSILFSHCQFFIVEFWIILSRLEFFFVPKLFYERSNKAWFTITQWMGYTNLTILSRPLLLCVVLGKIGPLSEACDCVNTKKRCPSYMGQVDGWRYGHLITLLGSDLSTHPRIHTFRTHPPIPNGAPWIRDFLLSASYSHISFHQRRNRLGQNKKSLSEGWRGSTLECCIKFKTNCVILWQAFGDHESPRIDLPRLQWR